MKTIRIADGVRVKCYECGKYHIVHDMTGNNIGWEDSAGWSGSYDCAHGFFESCKAFSLCPTHTKNRRDIEEKCLYETQEDGGLNINQNRR